MSSLAIGRAVGSYRITERIGSGGMGDVFKAVDVALERTVALKALRPELAARPGFLSRFRSEARTLARLDHPNIATLYSLIEDGGSLVMVMEYVEGRTFASIVRRRGPLRPDPAFQLFHQALAGVAHAHEAGVVHCDLKSANLMVNRRGLVKVMDFGIARVVGAEPGAGATGLIGTPEYLSPEQIRGDEATVRSDVYALGILLYELLTGRVPFPRHGGTDVLRAHLETPPPPPRRLGAALSETLEAALLRALTKDAARRYASVESFRRALLEAGAPQPQTSPTAPVVKAAPPEPAEVPALEAATTPLDAVAGLGPTRPIEPGEPTPEPRTGEASLPVAATGSLPGGDLTEDPGGDATLEVEPLAAPCGPRPSAPGGRRGLRWLPWIALLVAGALVLAAGILPNRLRIGPRAEAPRGALASPAPRVGPAAAPAGSPAPAAAEIPPLKPEAEQAAKTPAGRRPQRPAEPGERGWVIRR